MATIKLPYNFVELHDKVLESEPLPNRRYFQPERNSGFVRCTLKTLSPLYIAGEKGKFFNHGNPNEPVIPGSSLRGMVRNITQVITWSKLQPVTKKRMYLRDLLNRPDYMDWFQDNIDAGIIHKTSAGFSLEPCAFYKVHHHQLIASDKNLETELTREIGEWRKQHIAITIDEEAKLKNWQEGTENLSTTLINKLFKFLEWKFKQAFYGGGTFPDWKYQNKPVWIQQNEQNRVAACNLNKPTPEDGWIEGILVMTGWMNGKKHEYVFVQQADPEIISETYITHLVQALEDDDQISDWQKKAFAKDKPAHRSRRKAGAVRDGEPVFFIKEGDKVKFLGRACLFRLPYGKSPYDLLPEMHKSAKHIDMTEAIFGFVDKEKEGEPEKSYAVKGRVFFSDGIYQADGQSPWLKEEAFPPRILASPKPASYATYLEQSENQVQHDTQHENVGQLNKYSTPDAKLRGHKFYWHQVKKEDGSLVPQPLGYDEIKQPPNNRNFEQLIKPVKPLQTFEFKINFEELTAVELGALLWALTLPGTEHMEAAHKLGMGKSIGMGSVEVKILDFKLINLTNRYQTLESESYDDGNVEEFLNKFTKHMESAPDLGISQYSEHPRIKHLRLLLSRPGLDWEQIKYEDSQGFSAYKDKPVLDSVENVYRQARIKDEILNKEDSLIDQEIKGVVDADGVTPDGVMFTITHPEKIKGCKGWVDKKNLAGKQYRPGFTIKAKVIEIESDDEEDFYICTLDK